MSLGPHPSEMPESNAAWVLYQTGKYDGYVQNFKMACEEWEASARLVGVKPPRMFTMAKVASALGTPKVLIEVNAAANTRQAQMKVVGAAEEKKRHNSEGKAKTAYTGNGRRTGSDPDVRCGPEKFVALILLLAKTDLSSFEFINESQGGKAENGQPEIEQAKVSLIPLRR